MQVGAAGGPERDDPTDLVSKAATGKEASLQERTDQVALKLIKLQVEPREHWDAGKEAIPITVDIPDFSSSGLKLCEEQLEDIFQHLNEHVVNKSYPCVEGKRAGASRKVELQGRNVWLHRPNHNGGHSARQARLMQALYDLLDKHGSPQVAKLGCSEKLHALLAAYLLRAGRVDESSHKSQSPDRAYYKRSAQIYAAIAKQLDPEHPELIERVVMVMRNSCKPRQDWDAKIEEDPKTELIWVLTDLCHNIDLMRCYGTNYGDSNLPYIQDQIKGLIDEERGLSAKTLCDKITRGFGRSLCEATGTAHKYKFEDERWEQQGRFGFGGDAELFARCASDGALCWRQCLSVALPDWERSE